MYNELEKPIDKEIEDATSDEIAEQMFFMTVQPTGSHIGLTFKNGVKMHVTKEEAIEMISQLAIGCMLKED